MRLAPLTALLLGLASLPALAQTSLEARVIVRWKSEAPVVRALALPARAGHTEVADLMQRRAYTLAQRNGLTLRSGRALDARTQVLFAQGLDSATLARRLARDPQVELAAVDRRRHLRHARRLLLLPLVQRGRPGDVVPLPRRHRRHPGGRGQRR